MKLLDKVIKVTSRKQPINLYPIGDVHIGACNCAIDKFKKYLKVIAGDPNGYAIGGGDILDAVVVQDAKRFDPGALPTWMLDGNPDKVRRNIKDLVKAQKDYALELLDPIKHKLIGLIEGNHERSLAQYHNRDITAEMARELGTEELTDCAFIRFRFQFVAKAYEKQPISTVRMFICHGHGGGRAAGSEPNHLTKLAHDKDCEIVWRGHSHTFHILPPLPKLSIPVRGKLPEHPIITETRAANWGTWMRSYAQGPSTYDTRATYPARAMYTAITEIYPFTYTEGQNTVKINMHEYEM